MTLGLHSGLHLEPRRYDKFFDNTYWGLLRDYIWDHADTINELQHIFYRTVKEIP